MERGLVRWEREHRAQSVEHGASNMETPLEEPKL